MIVIKRPSEIEKMKVPGRIVASILDSVGEAVRPGISTWSLEVIAANLIEKESAEPAFKGYKVGRNVFPCCLCISVNEEVVHGIPSKNRLLQEGDIVSVDVGVRKNGYFGDSARTFAVGQIAEDAESLLSATKDALHKGIEQMVEKAHLEDIGNAIQEHAEQFGLGIVREFVGHGIGRKLHESPQVPNIGRKGRGTRLKNGMVFAIEPMLNLGTPEIEVLSDGWTVVTKDRKLSAHFEHTVAITEEGPLILTQNA